MRSSYRQPSLGEGFVSGIAVDRVLSQTTYLRRSPRSFSYRFPHPTSAPSGHLLPMEGGNDHASPFLWKGLPSTARRGWLPFLRRSRLLFAFPIGKAVLSLCHHPQPALPLRGQAKEAQGASCASLIGMHFPAEIRCIYFLMSFRIAAEGKTALPEVFLFADIAFDRPTIEESTNIEE